MRTRAVGVLLIAVLVGACGRAASPSPSPVPGSTPEIRVITGIDETRTIVTEPLEQVYPDNVKVEWPRVAVSFRDMQPMMFGIEGAEPFFKATDSNGSVIVDHTVEWSGSVVLIPPGSFTFAAYYRGCDANCWTLTPPTELCSTEGTLAAEDEYWLTVYVVAERCEFRKT